MLFTKLRNWMPIFKLQFHCLWFSAVSWSFSAVLGLQLAAVCICVLHWPLILQREWPAGGRRASQTSPPRKLTGWCSVPRCCHPCWRGSLREERQTVRNQAEVLKQSKLAYWGHNDHTCLLEIVYLSLNFKQFFNSSISQTVVISVQMSSSQSASRPSAGGENWLQALQSPQLVQEVSEVALFPSHDNLWATKDSMTELNMGLLRYACRDRADWRQKPQREEGREGTAWRM